MKVEYCYEIGPEMDQDMDPESSDEKMDDLNDLDVMEDPEEVEGLHGHYSNMKSKK